MYRGRTGKKLRILYLTPYYKPYLGGIERVIDKISTKISVKDNVEKVGILTTHFEFPRKFNPNLSNFEEHNNVQIYRIKNWPNVAPPYFSVPLVWFSIRETKNIIKEFNPNIIHWVGDGWFWGHFLSLLFAPKKCLVIFSPSYHPLTFDKKIWLRPINRLLIKRVNITTALSKYESINIYKNYSIPADKIKILPWGIDLPDKLTKREHKELTIISVGRLGPHKNQLFLLNAFKSAMPHFKHTVKLILIGRTENENYKNKLIKFIKENGLESNVKIGGEYSDSKLKRAYNNADIFVLFSKFEAFGLCFFEAMSYGLPVITKEMEPTKELLTKGSFLIPDDNLEMATDKLVQIINNDKLRKSMSLDALKYAEKFEWNNIVNKFLNLYQKS